MNGTYHMNGICYLLSSDLSSPPKVLPALTNLKRLVNRKSGYVEFSMGEMGLSAAYSQVNLILENFFLHNCWKVELY